MKKNLFSGLLIAAALGVLLPSCSRDELQQLQPQTRGAAMSAAAEGGKYAHGMFVLNEGSFRYENGWLLFVSPGGAVEPHAFRNANDGKELGNTAQDMCFDGDRLYIVAQTGTNLTIADAATLKQQAAWSFYRVLDKPTNIAVLDAAHVFVRDAKGVWMLDASNPAAKPKPSLIAGTADAEKNRMAVAGGRVFVGRGRKILALNARGVAGSIDMGAQVTGIIASHDGNIWASAQGYGQNGVIAKIDAATLSVVRHEIAGTSVTNGLGASPAICAVGDVLYFCDGAAPSIWRHDFAAGTTVRLVNAADAEKNAVELYNNANADPRTGNVVITTILGMKEKYKTNNILTFSPAGVLVGNVKDATAFPAGVWFR